MDRLIALVGLRVKLELRGMLLRRERLFGMLIALPFLALTSLLFSGYAFFGLRASTVTVSPRRSRASTRWRPTKPVPPVTSAFTRAAVRRRSAGRRAGRSCTR